MKTKMLVRTVIICALAAGFLLSTFASAQAKDAQARTTPTAAAKSWSPEAGFYINLSVNVCSGYGANFLSRLVSSWRWGLTELRGLNTGSSNRSGGNPRVCGGDDGFIEMGSGDHR